MRLETKGHTTIIRIEEGKANAINPEFVATLGKLLDTAEKDGAMAVVLTGYDHYFSSGLDLPLLIDYDRPAMTEFIDSFSKCLLRIFTYPRPVIAAINGHAIAGGCVLALQADYRVMAVTDVRIGLNEVRNGLGLPAAVIETLRAQVPAASIMPIALHGDLLTPTDAKLLGLIHEAVYPPDLERVALSKAHDLSAVPLAGYAHIKRSLRQPVLDAVAQMAHTTESWLDLWFADDTRVALDKAISKLDKK